MATQSEIIEKLDKYAEDTQKVSLAYDEVLTSEGEQDVTLYDGRTTPNLNKRLAGIAQAVSSVNGKQGNVEITREDLDIPSDEYLARQEKEDRFVITKHGRNQRDKNDDFISILDFGALPAPNDSTAAMNMAMIYLESNPSKSLYFPEGVWLTDTGIEPPSNSHIYGDGIDLTIIRLRNGTLTDCPIKVDQKYNVRIEGMTGDCNYEARKNLPTGGFSYGGTSVLVRESHDIRLTDVKGTNPYRHAIDITGRTYSVEGGNPNAWSPYPAYNVWLERCEAEAGRDDNITTHQCYNVWINNCLSKNPKGGYVENNNNCLEIDDGSRHIYVNNFTGIGGYEAVQIKGHANAAAPYDIHMSNITCINNYIGFECRHTDHYGSGALGFSESARGIFVNNLTIINPAILENWQSVGYTQPYHALWLRSYRDVQMNNVSIILDGLDSANDFKPAMRLSKPVVKITDGFRDAIISNLTVNGDLWTDDTGGSAGAVHITNSTVQNVIINNLVGINLGGRLLYSTNAVEGLIINGLNAINRSGSDVAITPYYIGGSTARLSGSINVQGYTSRGTYSANVLDYDILPSGCGKGYENNSTTRGYIRVNSNPSQDFGGSIRVSASGNMSLWFDGTQVGASLDAAGGLTTLGDIKFRDDGVNNIGSASRKPANIYATTGTINTSDERLKQQFRSLDEREKAAALEIKNSICLYKFNDAVDLKGDGARWHVGVKAQQVISILESHDLDAMSYAFVCFDEWEETSREAAGSRYAVRYDELAMFILSAM